MAAWDRPGGPSPQAVLDAGAEVQDLGALLREETTISQAAEQAGVDRVNNHESAHGRQAGALDALAKSKPRGARGSAGSELVAAKAEIARLSEALKEMGVRFMLVEEERTLGLRGSHAS